MISKIAVVIGLTMGAFAFSAIAAWTSATANPPAGNVSAPINVGLNSQSKLGQLFLNTDLSNPYAVGLSVFGKALFNGAIQASSSMLLDGSLSLKGVLNYKPGGVTPAANQVLTTDINGNASWAAPTSSGGGTTAESTACISTDIPKVSSLYTSISLLKNGVNICADNDGCTIRLETFDSSNNIHSFYSSGSPLIYKQSDSGYWMFTNPVGGGSAAGTNGDGTENDILASQQWRDDTGTMLMDDYPGVETSEDSWVFKNNSTSNLSYKVVICDF